MNTHVLLFAAALFISPISYAQTCPGSPPAGVECVAASSNKDITAHSVCKTVTNNHSSGKAIFVPINSAPEWTSFFNNTPLGVSAVTCGPSDPCSGKTIGQACDSTTALYAGTFDGGKYMVTPRGCSNSATPTCAGGADLTKAWRGSSGTFVDIPGITNITNAATPSSSSERGHVTTPLIVAHASIGTGSAAAFCQDMNYGGYTDWYLPSKSELAYIYCHSSGASNASYPQENPNCGGAKTTEISVSNGAYWTSTEVDTNNIWYLNSINGFQANNGQKDYSYMVRCIRRY